MVVVTLLNPQRRRLRWGRVESAPLMAASSAGQHRVIAAIDERLGGHVGSAPGGVQGFPQLSRIATETVESRVREAQGRVILLSGWIAASSPPGTGC